MKRDVKHLESFEADQGYRLMCSQEGYPSTMHMKILPVGYNPQGLIDFDEGPLFDQMENPPHQRAYFTRAWLRLQREQPTGTTGTGGKQQTGIKWSDQARDGMIKLPVRFNLYPN